ncbi:Pyruvate, phosphate dikinase [Symbiodinium microadriaticum]|uniref:pyruvate, phosphate dikinase n=1 Tax=Symbiodinium microadriaticum TaxID=2951 RepID=A0A1Q9CFJ4_SYMMI|nr:Pyruvate, phosphate dikinase [Symbiodinium microadriaticum]
MEETEHFRVVIYGMKYDLTGDWAHLLQSGMRTTSDKRLAIDMSALRQVVWRPPGELYGDPLGQDSLPPNGTTKVEWIETSSMAADALTKKMRSEQLLLLTRTGWMKIDRGKRLHRCEGLVFSQAFRELAVDACGPAKHSYWKGDLSDDGKPLQRKRLQFQLSGHSSDVDAGEIDLDSEGAGELMQIAVERGRRSRSGMKMGICGEHGGLMPTFAKERVFGFYTQADGAEEFFPDVSLSFTCRGLACNHGLSDAGSREKVQLRWHCRAFDVNRGQVRTLDARQMSKLSISSKIPEHEQAPAAVSRLQVEMVEGVLQRKTIRRYPHLENAAALGLPLDCLTRNRAIIAAELRTRGALDNAALQFADPSFLLGRDPIDVLTPDKVRADSGPDDDFIVSPAWTEHLTAVRVILPRGGEEISLHDDFLNVYEKMQENVVQRSRLDRKPGIELKDAVLPTPGDVLASLPLRAQDGNTLWRVDVLRAEFRHAVDGIKKMRRACGPAKHTYWKGDLSDDGKPLQRKRLQFQLSGHSSDVDAGEIDLDSDGLVLASTLGRGQLGIQAKPCAKVAHMVTTATPHAGNLLGGKGANLAEVLKREEEGNVESPDAEKTSQYPADLKEQVTKALALVETRTGRKFADATNPLLVSVRSGARASMPGMMVLNLGLNDATAEALAKQSGDRRFAFDSYRRFVQMYSDVVLGIELHNFEKLLERSKKKRGELPLQQQNPEDPQQQLWGAVGAVFGSWMNQRAKTYRKLHDIPEDASGERIVLTEGVLMSFVRKFLRRTKRNLARLWTRYPPWEEWGTAVNVQAMVFGNMGSDCATGVAFTRNPSNGAKDFYGEFLVNAQGEDVVAGIRTPQELTIKARESHGSDLPSLEEVMPGIFRELENVRHQLENHYRDMQIPKGKLYMLQTRTGKRTAHAALQIAVDMANEGLISKSQALMRLKPDLIDQLLHPTLDPKAKKTVIAKGLPASPGAAAGKVVFSADEAVTRSENGDKVILVRIETSPDDIHGLHAAEGVLTTRGGMTSHAAVVARGMGRPCVAGAGEVKVDYSSASFEVGDVVVREGQLVTIDGVTGEVMLGEVPTVPPQLSGAFGTVMSWADEFRTMQVRANAETPADARQAKEFGCEGIGLVRTEHMFFEGGSSKAMRQMILASDKTDRQAALDKLLAMQREDITELFRSFGVFLDFWFRCFMFS